MLYICVIGLFMLFEETYGCWIFFSSIFECYSILMLLVDLTFGSMKEPINSSDEPDSIGFGFSMFCGMF
jgi:hypothetical protein